MANKTTASILNSVSGEGENSTSPPQNFQQGQDALLQAARQQQLAEQRAAEAANRAAVRRPGGENDITNDVNMGGLKVQYTSLPAPNAANVKARGRKGK